MTTEPETRKISEKDGVKVKKDPRPRLKYSCDQWGNFLVRMHPQDKKGNLQRLYLFLAERGYDVLEKKDEFALMGRLSISKNWEKDLRKNFKLQHVMGE